MTRLPDERRLTGALLGCALGDALGLACEGMRPRAIAKRFGRIDRFHLLGRIGFISDDTEQSALLSACCGGLSGAAEGLEAEADLLIRRFRRAMIGWFWRLPYGIGLSTLRACLKMTFGSRAPGIHSAGNGAAMRAPALGVIYAHEPARRRRLGEAAARLTHTHPAGIEGALYAAEVAAALSRDLPAAEAIAEGRAVVVEADLRAAIDRALSLHEAGAPWPEAAEALGVTGWVIHAVGIATFGLLRAEGRGFTEALGDLIAMGGDADTHTAILGAWLGAQRGAEAVPTLVEGIHDGPFGPTHLRALGAALARGEAPPRFSRLYALLRNLALYPVVLGHGFRRLIPL